MNIFLGTFDGVLEVMRDCIPVDQVVSQQGRLRNLRLRASLQEAAIPWHEVHSRSEFDDLMNQLPAVNLCVVAGFSYILPQAFINRCRDIINFHPGILQLCRGPQPVAAAILRGHRQFGVSVHRIDSEEIDVGPLLAQRSMAIDYAASYAVNYQRIKALMVEMAGELLPRYRSDDWPMGEAWDSRGSAYFPRASAEEVAALARAASLQPWSR